MTLQRLGEEQMFCWLVVNSKKEVLNHTLWRSGLNHWPLPGFDIIVKEDDTFTNDRKVIAELFNGYFVENWEMFVKLQKMDYVADFTEHLLNILLLEQKAQPSVKENF